MRLYPIGIGVFVIVALSLMLSGQWSALEVLGVDPMEQPWADARTVSGASIAIERGLDPLVTNPGDPWQRVMNYPRVWLVFAALGLRPEHTWILAWLCLSALLAGLVILRPLAHDRATSHLLLLSIFAPTTWLAIERANNDILIFSMCCGAAALIAMRPAIAALLIATASILKLYPIVALVAYLREKPIAGLCYPSLLLVLFTVYTYAISHDLQLIVAGTLEAEWLSYGIKIAPSIIAKNLPISERLLISIAALGLLAICVGGYCLRLKTRLGAAGSPFSIAAFRIGSSIYLGSFLMGNSFDYRLMFLILTIPQLAAWARVQSARLRALSRMQLITILLVQWSQTWRAGMEYVTGHSSYGLLLDEALTWYCWIGLAVLCLLTLPDWLVPPSKRGQVYTDATEDRIDGWLGNRSVDGVMARCDIELARINASLGNHPHRGKQLRLLSEHARRG